jgi:hypothetical protein
MLHWEDGGPTDQRKLTVVLPRPVAGTWVSTFVTESLTCVFPTCST